MDPLTGGLLIGGANLLGSVFGTTQNNANAQQMQQQAEQYNTQMVQQQEAYQTQMSNSAYQRASADMTPAGLNPMMMFGSGGPSSTPSGANASIQPAQKTSALSGIGPAVQTAINSATQLKTANATVDNLVAENAKIKTDTLLDAAKTSSEQQVPALTQARTQEAFEQSRKNYWQWNATRADLPNIWNAARTSQNQESMDPDVRRALDIAGFSGRKVNEVLSPITNIVNSAMKVRNSAKAWP